MKALEYAEQLVRFDSTWYRSNAEISDYVEGVLKRLGFVTERAAYEDEAGVRKVCVLGRRGGGTGGLAYFGHTDVVPADSWFTEEHGPFEPRVVDGRLYGRGSCDMKGSMACMLAAAERVAREELAHPLYISCTADEEVNHAGADQVVSRSSLYREAVQGGAWGIVGEPTQLQVVYAHKGGYRFTVTARGRAAHSSTREGINANLALIPFLVEMKKLHEETESDPRWHDSEFDPPTLCCNILISDHTRAPNITPAESVCRVALRPMPRTDVTELDTRVRQLAADRGLEFHQEVSLQPFRTDPESDWVRLAADLAGGQSPRTVSYGTEASNLVGLEHLIVLGPGNIAQAHTDSEWISLEQLDRGTDLYEKLIRRLCL